MARRKKKEIELEDSELDTEEEKKEDFFKNEEEIVYDEDAEYEEDVETSKENFDDPALSGEQYWVL